MLNILFSIIANQRKSEGIMMILSKIVEKYSI